MLQMIPEDIDQAVRELENSLECPIARMLNRCFPDVAPWRVDCYGICENRDAGRLHLGPDAAAFIYDWDCGRNVHPLTLDIDDDI